MIVLFQVFGFAFAVWLIWMWQAEMFREDISRNCNKWKAGIKRLIYGVILVLLALLFVYGIGSGNTRYYQGEEESYGDIEHYEPKW